MSPYYRFLLRKGSLGKGELSELGVERCVEDDGKREGWERVSYLLSLPPPRRSKHALVIPSPHITRPRQHEKGLCGVGRYYGGKDSAGN